MAITSARMQMRRGLEADFDPDKMQPGEWAVSLDKKYVRMCFSVGVCVRMATYDSFEEDMAQIEEILSKCETIEEAVAKINTEVSANAKAVAEYTEQAKKYRDEAKKFRDEAESIAGIDVATKDKAGIVKPDGITIRVDEDGTIHADNGTVDYNELENKPSINGMELSGDKSLDELGIASVKALEETNSKVNIIIEKAELNIKNIASGENIHLTDSANSKVVEFGLYGKAEQNGEPTPDNPIEIVVSGSDGSVEVVSCGNQLFNANEVEIGKAWNTANNTARAIEVIECKPNTTYTITCDSTLFDGVYYFQKVNKTDTTQIGDGGIIKNNLTITTNENANFLIIQFNKDSVSKTDIENAKVMVNEGTTALPYEPYKETTSTIPTPNGLCGIKVSSGGNYTDENGQQWICDEIVKYADGSGKKIQRIGKYVFNGTESWYKNGESENEYRYYLNKTRIGIDTVNNNGMCTHFQIANTTSQTTILIYSPSVPTSLYIGAQDILTTENTVESFKEWLSNNNVSILYILATPIITDLSAEEIAEIEKLHTFYPVTNISNDADCGMSVKYLCDSKRYIDNRIAELASELLEATI